HAVGIFDLVGHAGAAALGDAHAQAHHRPVGLGQNSLHARGGGFGQPHHLGFRTGRAHLDIRPDLILNKEEFPAVPKPYISIRRTQYQSEPYHMLSTSRASSDMRLGSQGGSHTRLTLTSRTPGTLATAFSTMCGSSAADGQLGVVSVMSRATARSSAMSTL